MHTALAALLVSLSFLKMQTRRNRKERKAPFIIHCYHWSPFKFLAFVTSHVTIFLQLLWSDQTVQQIPIRHANGMNSDSRVSMSPLRTRRWYHHSRLELSSLFRPDSVELIRYHHVLLSTSSRHLTKIQREMSATKTVETSIRQAIVTNAVSELAYIDVYYHRNILWIENWMYEQVYFDLIPIPVRGLLTAAVVSCCIK